MKGEIPVIFPWDQLYVTTRSVFCKQEDIRWNVYRKNPFSALWYILGGHATVYTCDEEYLIQTGSVVLLPINIPFRAKITVGHAYLDMLVVQFSLLTRSNHDWLLLYKLPTLLDKADLKKSDFIDLFETYSKNDSLHRYRSNGMFHLLFGTLLEANLEHISPIDSIDNKHYLSVFKVISWMDEHLKDHVTLQDLAKVIHVSTDYLNDLFKSVVSMTPIQYLIHQRIQKAKKLLRQKHIAIKYISQSVGIEDPLYFSRMFKKIEGISPSRYRENNVVS
jgi:AraC-like DNA-binding protein